nr:MAG TPA: hypothetical protein [Caudoviricetes sp.]
MKSNKEITLVDIERGLLTAATLYDLYGACMKPLLDSIERDYLAARQKVSQVDRIKRLIAENSAE